MSPLFFSAACLVTRPAPVVTPVTGVGLCANDAELDTIVPFRPATFRVGGISTDVCGSVPAVPDVFYRACFAGGFFVVTVLWVRLSFGSVVFLVDPSMGDFGVEPFSC